MKIYHLSDKNTFVSSSWIGLFWLKPDLSDFAAHYADKELSDADLLKNEDYYPSNTHRGSWNIVKNNITGAEKLKFNSLPRGRVEFSAREKCFIVKTGNWLTSSLKTLILKKYHLVGKKVKFEQNDFWNSRP